MAVTVTRSAYWLPSLAWPAQIQSDGQFLLRNIPALLCRCGANLLHCRSPFYLCFEHVDNLGAYRIPPETGLLLSSVYDNESALSERDGLTIAEFEPNRSGVLSFPEFVCDHHISTGLDGLSLRVVNDMLGF